MLGSFIKKVYCSDLKAPFSSSITKDFSSPLHCLMIAIMISDDNDGC